MTTICYDGKMLGADSRMTIDGMIVTDECDKLHRFKDVYYRGDRLVAIAFAGSAADTDKVIDFFYQGADHKELSEHGVGAIIVGDSYVYHLEPNTSYLIRYPLTTQLSDGSGAAYALSAMKLGLSTIEAINHAKKLDCYSGGRVRAISFKRG